MIGWYLIAGTIVYLVEPPYTERYVRWCERRESIDFRLLDCFVEYYGVGGVSVDFLYEPIKLTLSTRELNWS
jgi:hypothetical protein